MFVPPDPSVQILLDRWKGWQISTPATTAAGILADVLWMLAYLATIRVGFRDRSYGFPFLAICLNLSWEIVFSVIVRPESNVRLTLTLLWLAIDCVIAYQLLRFGRRDQLPQLQPYFGVMVAGTLLLAVIGHLTFHHTYEDPGGQQDAFVINLVMSVLFIFLFFDRPGMRGLSYAAAWLKMLGTLILSIGNYWLMRDRPGVYGFFFFLFAAIFLFDVIYLALMMQARRRLRQADGVGDGQESRFIGQGIEHRPQP